MATFVQVEGSAPLRAALNINAGLQGSVNTRYHVLKGGSGGGGVLSPVHDDGEWGGGKRRDGKET